jgi:hypothetical protein
MSSSFSIEESSPYHLHHDDSPGTVLVSQPLDGDNYHTWSRSMVMALTAKNKLSFLNGSLAKPVDESGAEYQAWLRCNTMVSSWILNSVSKDIAASVIYIDNAADVWTDLKERFSQKNGPVSTRFKNPFPLFHRMIFWLELILQKSKLYGTNSVITDPFLTVLVDP